MQNLHNQLRLPLVLEIAAEGLEPFLLQHLAFHGIFVSRLQQTFLRYQLLGYLLYRHCDFQIREHLFELAGQN